jgi:hypothetical protein
MIFRLPVRKGTQRKGLALYLCGAKAATKAEAGIVLYLPDMYLSFYSLFYLAVVFATATLLISCDPEVEFVSGDSVDLAFSVDTLRFDTVFVELGSATRSFKVYNRSNNPVRIDQIAVRGTTGVAFRFNADGFQGGEVTQAVIWPEDSIYVFVEVTVDPTQPEEISPFIAEDQLVFSTGDREQIVYLEAFGQNANYFPSRFNQGVGVRFTCNNGTEVWDSELPYVLYGEIQFDSCALEVAAGTRIYVHGGIARNERRGIFNDGFLVFLKDGSLRIRGTVAEPVIISTDRLEPAFQDEPGQWLGIVLGPESKGNLIENARIYHGIFGIYADSLAELELKNTEIAFTAGSGIAAFGARVRAENCLFHNNGTNDIQFIDGGELEMDFCTISSFNRDGAALALQNFQCYDDACDLFSVNPIRATLRNCILAGSGRDEILFSDAAERQEPSLFRVDLQNCAVRVDNLLTAFDGLYSDFFSAYCTDCFTLELNDPLFLDRTEYDFSLDTMSVARDQGIPLPNIRTDLLGRDRQDPPDLGALEFIE